MPARVRYITDPASPDSWGIEPAVIRLVAEFGDELEWTFVMGGLGREFDVSRAGERALEWLESAAESRMPVDPLAWRFAPLQSSYPACMAMKAAADQAPDGGVGYLRAARVGGNCIRQKLAPTESLVDLARLAGLDATRFQAALASNATLEAFGNYLEIARDVP